LKRIEGVAKLTGRERYIDDLDLGEHLWGATVRSSAPRGRVTEIRFSDEVDWSEFTIVDHTDVPGDNSVFLLEDDQPVLVADEIRHVHEPVVLLAHPSRDAVRRAAKQVEVVVDPSEPYLDFRAAPTPEQVQRGDDNLLKRLEINKGDVEAALAAATHVIEGVYETGAQEHVYLETQGMAAWVEDGVVTVQGSMQCPYYIAKAAERALGLDHDHLRVIHAPTGGGFGGKEEFPSVLAIHTALLAMKSGKTVKMIYERGEDMAATTKRHPSRVRHRTGVDEDGRLVAQDIEVVLDGGAYQTLSPVVLSRGIIHAAGPYACENVRIVGKAILTNSVPYGAFRGFGAPQSQFANERHMDVVAREIGLDPVEFRRRNLIDDGDATATGQVIDDGTDRVGVMEVALERADYAGRRAAHRDFNAAHPYLRRGLGLATFFHGAGFTGAGEVYLASRVAVAGLPDGRVEVLSASTEMGQGSQTVFTQIAAQRLGYSHSDIVIAVPDTHRVPDSGPTVASRTSMVVGRILDDACTALCERLGDVDLQGDALREAIVAWHRDHPGATLSAEASYHPPPGVEWDEDNYRGEAYGAFAWAAYLAEVEIDLRTYTARCTDFLAVQEVGHVLNETLARGQIQGGVVQGIGWALMEECTFRDGAMVNNQLTNYIIPTSADVPPIDVVFLQNPYAEGALGAKGIGELPLDGPAPALANAVADALGVEPRFIPMTPERLMDLVEGTASHA